MGTPKQLDAVLFYIKQSTDLDARINANYVWNLYINRTPELKISELLFADILRKLIKDGYLFRGEDGFYHLTVDGRNFKGYVKASKWYNRLSKITITEGVIYTIIATILIITVTYVYNLIVC